MTHSLKDDFRTPRDIFNQLDKRYGPFEIDVAAHCENNLCENYFDIKMNGLNQIWKGKVWSNPPYDDIESWLKKGIRSLNEGDCELVCFLIPSYTDLAYWHDYIFPNAYEIVFFRSRINFGGPFSVERQKGSSSRNPSAGVIITKLSLGNGNGVKIKTMSNKGVWIN